MFAAQQKDTVLTITDVCSNLMDNCTMNPTENTNVLLIYFFTDPATIKIGTIINLKSKTVTMFKRKSDMYYNV